GADIQSIRLDPVSSSGKFELDYLMLVPKNENDDIRYDFSGSISPWKASNFADAAVSNGVLTGTTQAHNGLIDNSSLNYLGSDYQTVYVRMKTQGLTADAEALLYTNLTDASGKEIKPWWQAYNGYNHATVSVSAANDGEYVLYKFDFSSYTAYCENRVTQMVLNMVNCADVTVSVDYIVLKNSNTPTMWDFNEPYFNEWTISSNRQPYFTVSDGLMHFVYPETTNWIDPLMEVKGQSFKADDYVGLEVVMKHTLDDANSKYTKMKVFYTGTDANGNSFVADTKHVAQTDIGTTTGDGYRLWYVDLENAYAWAGSTITVLRLDPVDDYGDFDIDYIRLVPAVKENPPLEPETLTLNYAFDNSRPGSADGVISLDFGGQDPASAELVQLYWATGDAEQGYTALGEYTMLRTLSGENLEAGYQIRKNLLIPVGVTSLAAQITDSEKTFTLYYPLPAEKCAPEPGTPLYTAAFISDIHCGGWGSESAPNARLVAARAEINELADVVVAVGDLTQWFGAYSGAAFANYHDASNSYNSNGETSTDPEKLYAGKSQWEVLTDYFKGFTVPVYAVQGNHDVPDSSKWNTVCCTEDWWKTFLHDWIAYSNTAENGARYAVPVERDESVNYYDTEVYGHHFIFLEIPRADEPHYSFGDEQLAWLDKTLFENEQTGKPIFVFGHVPVESELSGGYWDEQLKASGADAALKAILAKHPTAIYVTGHTHYSLDTDFYGAIDGAQSTYSLINDGGITTISVPNSETNPDDITEIAQSHGVIAEVYEDRILIRGRDFVNGKWISRGLTELTFKSAEAIREFSVQRIESAGGTTLAVVDPYNTEVTYTWYLNGEAQAVTGKTLEAAADFSGYVAVRATDADGNYRSCLYDTLADVPQPVETRTAVSIRTAAPAGIRFMGSVKNDFLAREDVEVLEYGFVVGLQENFTDSDPRLGMENTVSGVSYSKEKGIELIYNTDDECVYFTGVVIGVPKENLDTPLKVVTYMRYRYGEYEYTLYGKAITRSVTDVLKLFEDSPDYEQICDALGI
ncbi:MAG: metallophosphoesterase family protein, partial [Eubacteriales bacterium]